MNMTRVRILTLSVLGMAWLAAPAVAQQKLLNSPQEIARCLCQEKNIDALRQKMDAGKGAVDREKAEVDAMDKDIAQQRPRVNPSNETSIEVFKTLLDQRDAKWSHLKDVTEPVYFEANGKYNAAVQGFQASCGGTMYNMEALAIAKRNLVCPAN